MLHKLFPKISGSRWNTLFKIKPKIYQMCNIILYYSFIWLKLLFYIQFSEAANALIENESSKHWVRTRNVEHRHKHIHPTAIALCFTICIWIVLAVKTNISLCLWRFMAHCMCSIFIYCVWIFTTVVWEPQENVLFYR